MLTYNLITHSKNINTCQKIVWSRNLCKLFEVGISSLYLPSAQSYPKESASFWMHQSCFSVQWYFCKISLVSLFKWQNISTKQARLLIHISYKWTLLIKSSFLLKTVLFLPWAQQDMKQLILNSHLTSVWSMSSCYEFILSHCVFNLEFKGQLQISLAIFTSLFSTFSKSLSLQFNAPDGLCNE